MVTKMNLLNNNVATIIMPEEHRNLMHKHISVRKTRRISGILSVLLASVGSLLLGILSTQFSLLDLTLDERARMQPNLLPYHIWQKPDPIVRMSARIFAVQNAQRFIDGDDARIELDEIGPIIYREHLRHDNVTRHAENSTMSYTAVRWLEFLEDENEPGILNRTVTVPNFALLSAASLFHDATFITKLAFKALKLSSGDTAFINITVYDYLWNYRSKLVRSASRLVPFMVPVENAGILAIVYDNFIDQYNVRIGDKYTNSQFFHIESMNGAPVVPGYGKCNASVVGSTEGVFYGQRMTPADRDVVYWRRALCRSVPLFYVGDTTVGRLRAQRYLLLNNTYDRFENKSADCYRGGENGKAVLSDGLSDLSKCFFGLPLAASNPHFYGREHLFTHKISGLRPTFDQHVSFIELEPTMGVPIRQCAKSQSNLVVPDLRGLTSDLARFSDMVLPLFWLQYELQELTTLITVVLIIVVNVLPVVQVCFTVLLFVSSALFLLLANMRYTNSPRLLLMPGRRRSPSAGRGFVEEEQCADDVMMGVIGAGSVRNRKLSATAVVVKAIGNGNGEATLVRHIVLGSQAEKSESMRKNRV